MFDFLVATPDNESEYDAEWHAVQESREATQSPS